MTSAQADLRPRRKYDMDRTVYEAGCPRVTRR